MKKIGLILIGCLAFVGLDGAHADNLDDAVRAAVRRGTNATATPTRQRGDFSQSTTTPRPQTSRTANVVTRNATGTRTTNAINRAAEQTGVATNVVARGTTGTNNRTRSTTQTLTARTPLVSTDRSATRAATTRTPARATTTTATREDILMRNYSKCKTVFNECMDEFCANKDAQLKRCACSSRVNEFDTIKKQLSNIDEKMLDFNQRLLTVSMDDKDVAALSVATEGEKAFYDTRDTSGSKRTLDEIAKKLNTSFDSSNFSTTLSGALSWSLDLDSAFDTVDSLGGISTTAKSGTALYSAALPVCREMAAEVCSENDLAIAESGYNVLITQDCNTVAKTYQSATDSARAKVLESSALLDISRLNVYQTDNADDILTCKTKMLDMLTDSTVCGANLEKCLDITGEYIDPSTGEAFLSSYLADLGDLITRPTGEETWSTTPQNAAFVQFLDSKKKFLEPAMEHCVDIADTVWDAFVEDALSQIKIAQMRKLEDVRQSCTTLTAQCLTSAIESITDFDARAISTFGVAADITANAMCDNVLSSCTTLLNTVDVDAEWYAGMTGIQTDITYDTIMHTCREVGRACVIQVCTSTSGNFGLCENIDTSINRKSIINRTACWDEVVNCVRSAGSETLAAIFAQNKLNTTTEYALYESVYGNANPTISNKDASTCITSDTGDNNYCIYDMCYRECNKAAYTDSDNCRACRLAESIWGNCEAAPTTPLTDTGMHNKIRKPSDNVSTLLYWFAQNTNTTDAADSCRDTTCGIGFTAQYDWQTNTIMCVDSNKLDTFSNSCDSNKRIQINNSITLCCSAMGADLKQGFDNCCAASVKDSACVPQNAIKLTTFTVNSGNNYYNDSGNTYTLWCDESLSVTDNGQLECSGHFIVTYSNHSIDPQYDDSQPTTPYATESFPKNNMSDKYTRTFKNNAWDWYNNTTQSDITPDHWTVSFGQ